MLFYSRLLLHDKRNAFIARVRCIGLSRAITLPALLVRTQHLLTFSLFCVGLLEIRRLASIQMPHSDKIHSSCREFQHTILYEYVCR